ncbi:MAG: class I SAM-dependent methyltransferase [Candidatus Nitronauta litoralis]|uniref:Class I SAM-dependent methyltransferase n=1 Tax=Candidatus Nitronauta litoralis TaxID=2705533 RepID=A0A7T0FYY8_9BACT|nr:MAG: class I SAM-dependent methyltransferase [Candidatus Nitronauta litoralis]
MNLLHLFEGNQEHYQKPLYIYSAHHSKTQFFLNTISKVYGSQKLTVILRGNSSSLDVPQNMEIISLDLSETTSNETQFDFKKVVSSGSFDSLLIQNDESSESFEVVDLMPLLSIFGDSHRIAFLNANFQIIPVNELIAIWKNSIHLKDAGLTVNCPGLMIGRELAHLERLARTRPPSDTVIEIGRYYGRSTIALGQGVKSSKLGKVISIDPFSAPDIQERIKAHCVSHFVELWDQTSRSGFERWRKERAKYKAGMLFIDGDHRYPAVIQDIEMWSSVLMPGGIIALHDYYETQPDCLKALNEKIIWSGNFEQIELKTSLLIARKK